MLINKCMKEMTNMIRILQVVGGLNTGGAENLLMSIYRAIDRNEIQFDIIKHSKMPQFFDDEIRRLGGCIYSCPQYKGWNHMQYVKWWEEFFAKHTEYRIIHSHIRSTASIFLKIASKHGLVTIAHSHNTSNGKGISSFAKQYLQKSLAKNVDFRFACSEESGKWLFGENYDFTIIKNGIDLRRFTFSEEARKNVRKELKISDDEILVGHIGRLNTQKNHLFLLDIFDEIYKHNSKAKLIMLGEGPLEAEILEKRESLQSKNAIQYLGVKGNTQDYYSAMDCFVLPSLWEGLPVALVEAQAEGLPCFVSNTITNEVKLSDELHYLPINLGTGIWKDTILANDLKRYDAKNRIIEAGFDINDTAEKLSQFYLIEAKK